MISIDILKKVISELLKPIDESILLMKRIEVKLDTQAYSNLKGALNSLEDCLLNTPVDDGIIKSILLSLSKSSVYFTSLIKQVRKEIEDWEDNFYNHKKTTLFEDIKFFKKGPFKTGHTHYFNLANYTVLYINSEIGRIICMAELKYQSEHLKESIGKLRSIRRAPEKYEIKELWDSYTLYGFGEYIIDTNLPGIDRIKIINEWDSLSWAGKRLCKSVIYTKSDFVEWAVVNMFQYLRLIKILKVSKDVDSLVQNIANKKAIEF